MERAEHGFEPIALDRAGDLRMEKRPSYSAVKRPDSIELLVLGLLTALIMVLAIPLVSQATNASDLSSVERSNTTP